MKLFKIYYEILQWRNKCLDTQYFSTQMNISAIDFDRLFDEIMYKKIH